MYMKVISECEVERVRRLNDKEDDIYSDGIIILIITILYSTIYYSNY